MLAYLLDKPTLEITKEDIIFVIIIIATIIALITVMTIFSNRPSFKTRKTNFETYKTKYNHLYKVEIHDKSSLPVDNDNANKNGGVNG